MFRKRTIYVNKRLELIFCNLSTNAIKKNRPHSSKIYDETRSRVTSRPLAGLNYMNKEQLTSTYDNKKSGQDEANNSRTISPTIIVTGMLLLIGSVMEKSKKNVMLSDSIENSSNDNHSWSSSSLTSAILSRNFVADAVACVSPAVVNILSESQGGAFSAGSGFIISSEGIIVTNAHVVAKSKNSKVVVTFTNGRIKKGTVQSMDSSSDIAIIKLDIVTEDLPTVKFGSSSKIRAGCMHYCVCMYVFVYTILSSGRLRLCVQDLTY